MRLTQGLIERSSVLVHLIGWVTLVTLPFLFLPLEISTLQRPEVATLLPAKLISDALLIAFFYLNLHRLTPQALRGHTIGPVLIGGLGCLLLLTFSQWVVLKGLPYPPGLAFPPFPGGVSFPTPPRSPLWLGSFLPTPQLLSFVLVIGASTSLALWRDLVRTREAQQQMSLEKVTAELAMLKLQISPHFLFNTLNNIRWLTSQSSDRAEEAIIKLSQLLRYIIYQAHHDQVTLDQEITHLHNYIDLQKMRLIDPDGVRFDWQGDITGKTIVPLLLIPFVENAFKHGQHSQYQSLIHIELTVAGQNLIFKTQNRYFDDHTSLATEDSGIGIQNVKRRLNLHYPDRHQLTLDCELGIYNVFLQVSL
ncbi:sensor histidine kinase [Larkinella sp. C7]|jgi:hypothetical protein|uniref:sensor histidine kinase n=1 Tax=Larkinella sp. C7 TaxID=2576607 RepID=UPI00111128B7|nr:sensor histidine kinase [Larkinella sp. C7]